MFRRCLNSETLFSPLWLETLGPQTRFVMQCEYASRGSVRSPAVQQCQAAIDQGQRSFERGALEVSVLAVIELAVEMKPMNAL